MPALLSVRRLALAAALLPLLPAAAFAAVATVSQGVNLRSGPGTNFGVVAQLRQGDSVDISKCQGSFCYVTTNAGNGWVSATYLTRDAVQKPAPKIVAAVPPSSTVTSSEMPSIAVAKPPVTTPKPVVTASIPAASTPKPAITAPQQAFPPAYDSAAAAPVEPPVQPPAKSQSAGGPASNDFSPLPDAGAQPFPNASSPALGDAQPATDGDDDDTATADVPRPKADIPNGALSGPDDDDYANDPPSASSDDDFSPPANNGGFANDVPDDGGWNAPSDLRSDRFQRLRRFGFRGDFANLDGGTGPARACFVAGDGGPGFCVHEGQHLADLSDWAGRPLFLRNPAGLEVTVCTDAVFRDCHTYGDSGPVRFGAGRSIASVSVAAAGD